MGKTNKLLLVRRIAIGLEVPAYIQLFVMPSGIALLTVLIPENAALAATKILGLSNPDLQQRIIDFQDKNRNELEEADNNLVNEK